MNRIFVHFCNCSLQDNNIKGPTSGYFGECETGWLNFRYFHFKIWNASITYFTWKRFWTDRWTEQTQQTKEIKRYMQGIAFAVTI